MRTYDTLARLSEVISHGNTTATDDINGIKYEYLYGSNRIVKEWQDHYEDQRSRSPYITYEYDETDTSGVYTNGLRRNKIIYYTDNDVDGEEIEYTYGVTDYVDDRLHRVEKIESSHYNGTSEEVTTYSYNGVGRLVNTKYNVPNVTSKKDTSSGGDGDYELLDRWGRILTQEWGTNTPTVLDSFSYEYDYAGNPTLRNIPSSLYAGDDKDYAYGYDGLHRIKTGDRGTWNSMTTTIDSNTLDLEWVMDGWGNWVQKKVDAGTSYRTHNDANEITQLNFLSIHVAHDAAGNMTKVIKPGSFTVHYDTTYDAWNRLVEVKEGMTTVATYTYDGLGRRIKADSDEFWYSDTWQVLNQQGGDEDSEYIWHPYYVDALAVRYWDGDDDGNYTDADETHYAAFDVNYNVTSLIDRSAAVIERYEYRPYGEVAFLDASFGSQSGSDVNNPVLFTGRRFDSDTELYYYRNRYYHAQLGRFISRDPIEFAGSEWNLYEYVNGRPTVLTDPNGQSVVIAPPGSELPPAWIPRLRECKVQLTECLERAIVVWALCKMFHDDAYCEKVYEDRSNDCHQRYNNCINRIPRNHKPKIIDDVRRFIIRCPIFIQ